MEFLYYVPFCSGNNILGSSIPPYIQICAIMNSVIKRLLCIGFVIRKATRQN